MPNEAGAVWGVFGSAFDPPTWGHWDALCQVAPNVAGIFLVPSFAHAFAKTMQPFAHRVAMLRQLVEREPAPVPLRVCTIEQVLAEQYPQKPVYTYRVLGALQGQYPDLRLCFVRGPDNAAPDVWRRFFRYEAIEKNWPLLTVEQRVAVRSTMVRTLCGQTRPDGAALRRLVPDAVADYVLAHGLYQGL